MENHSRVRTRSMAKDRNKDIKPDDLSMTFRKECEYVSNSLQTRTYSSVQERINNGVVLGAETELSEYNSNKKQPQPETVCIHKVELNLSKHWHIWWKKC